MEESERIDYERFVRMVLEAEDSAFSTATRARDPLAIALLSLVQGDPTEQPSRFDVLIEIFAGEPGMSAFLLSMLEMTTAPSELLKKAIDLLSNRASDFPLDESQKERLGQLVINAAIEQTVRRKALWWLWSLDPSRGKSLSLELLRNEKEPATAPVKDQAVQNLASLDDQECRSALEAFAIFQFEAPQNPDLPAPSPLVGVAALDQLARHGNADHVFVEEVLVHCAAVDLDVTGNIEALSKSLNKDAMRGIVSRLEKEGHVSWLTTYLLPELLSAQPELVAKSVGEGWWPDPCLNLVANHPWETIDDSFYEVALRNLHKLPGADAAKTAIRQRVHARCRATSGEAAGEMPRLGARELLRLGLSGDVSVDDEDLLGAIGCLDSAGCLKEIQKLSWRGPDRARRLSQILGAVYPRITSDVIALALLAGSRTAVAFVEGLPAAAVDDNAESIAGVCKQEDVLRVLCEKSDALSDLVLEDWEANRSIVAFKALDRSNNATTRLAAVPEAARDYGRVTSDQRADLIRALDDPSAQISLLIEILGDRAGPPQSRPTHDDILMALSLIGEHLEAGADPSGVLASLQVICEEVRDLPIRRGAYAALSRSSPRQEVVEVLLKRARDESSAMKVTVGEALARVGSALYVLAGDSSNLERGKAISLLARIEPERAATHARDLLVKAEIATDRQTAARVLGECGHADDCSLLEDQLEHEPAPEARDEMRRSIRRLKVGDKAAAHEMLLELTDLDSDELLMQTDPDEFYGDWAGQLVEGLGRVSRAEGNSDWGTAIDQLNEVSKVLVFRAIETAGNQSGASAKMITAIGANMQDYGPVVSSQQIAQHWGWMKHLASMYEMRTEHLAPRGSMEPHQEPDQEEWKLARGLFKRGGSACLQTIKAGLAP